MPALSLDDVSSKTHRFIMPLFVDNVYKASPVFYMLATENRQAFEGGTEIDVPFMFAELRGGSIARGGTFDTSYVQTDTAFRFIPKEYWSNVTLFGYDLARNRGPEAVMSMVETKMFNLSQKMAKLIAVDFYLDGQGTLSPITGIDGMAAAVDDGTNYPTYGGITRSAIASGDNIGINSYVQSAVGILSLAALQVAYGATWFGRESVNLMVSNQDVWNRVWQKIQLFERIFDTSSPVARAGFRTLKFNGCPLAVDQYAPLGTLWGFNTNFITMHLSTAPKYQFGFTGWKEETNSDNVAGQSLFLGDVTLSAPRLCFKLTGVTG